jgi:hypothetical protein
MKYGQIKQSILTYLTEHYSTGNFKVAFKKAVVPLLETKKFKEIYYLYSQIEENRFDDQKSAEFFLHEAVQRIKSLSKGLHLNIPEEITSVQGQTNLIYENIDTLVYSKDVMKRVVAMKSLWEHLTRAEGESALFAPVNEAILINILTSEFNQQYSNITESEKQTISNYLNLNEADLKNAIKEKQELATQKLNDLAGQCSTKEEKDKVFKTLNEMKNMDCNRYNLFRLDSLLQDLG